MFTVFLIAILAFLKVMTVISIPWTWVIAIPILLKLFFAVFSKDCTECL